MKEMKCFYLLTNAIATHLCIALINCMAEIHQATVQQFCMVFRLDYLIIGYNYLQSVQRSSIRKKKREKSN